MATPHSPLRVSYNYFILINSNSQSQERIAEAHQLATFHQATLNKQYLTQMKRRMTPVKDQSLHTILEAKLGNTNSNQGMESTLIHHRIEML
jgi:hypothetical protein